MKVQRPLVTHTCKGKRFEDHGLDLDVLPDLYAYKELLVATAKELWKRHHPDRQRLPKNFEDSLSLKFSQIQPGSAAVPIYREIETDGQGELWRANEPDELDQAVELVARAVLAADADQTLPDELPKNVIPLFQGYGSTLREDESFEQQPAKSSTKASYTRESRERLLQFCAPGYTDRVDFVGEVRPAGEVPFEANAKPIWQVIEEIGASVPPEEWEKVPADGAQNLGHYLYGHAKKHG
jgi:hypothetical protein